MGALTRELEAVQNPALGAMLIWRFLCGFDRGSASGAGAPFQYAFLPLPLLMHEQTAELLAGTWQQSGLRKFSQKFMSSSESKADLLLGLNRRAIQMRPLTLQSIQIALASSLIGLDVARGLLSPLSKTAPKRGVPESVRRFISAAEKLGRWLSEITPYEVGVILRIVF